MADTLFGDLIGKPFKYGARGPHEYDCWGLVMECYRRVHGVELPDLASPEEAAVQHALGAAMQMQPCWKRLEQALAGSIVALRVGRYVCHTGFSLGDGRMLHTWETTNGVIVQNVDAWRHRIEGFYRYVG